MIIPCYPWIVRRLVVVPRRVIPNHSCLACSSPLLAPCHSLSLLVCRYRQYHGLSPQLGLYRYAHQSIRTSRSTPIGLAASSGSNETPLYILGTALAKDNLSVRSGHLGR